MHPEPPELERQLGLASYLTKQPGLGGKLRGEPEHFRVIELGDGPKESPTGQFVAARIRLRNWETNRFVGIAARKAGIKRNRIGFAGMKDKRAVTEQWFSFKASEENVQRVAELEDVEILEMRRCNERQYAGAHDGNRFVLTVSEARNDESARSDLAAMAQTIADEGGVPRFFGPQRFGASWRPLTHRVGQAIISGDLEEAVRLYVGHPLPTENPEAVAARTLYEDTRDAAAALDIYPDRLGPERDILRRLVNRPEDWRNALQALPGNLLQLFIHAQQSWVFNHIVSARIEAGLGLSTAHIGDQIMAFADDGTTTHEVTAWNQVQCQREIDRGRAAATAPLPGLQSVLATGEPGEIEAQVFEKLGVDLRDYRCFAMPKLASTGRRRTVLQRVSDLEATWENDQPVVSFGLGKGDYATVVMREFMKSEADAY